MRITVKRILFLILTLFVLISCGQRITNMNAKGETIVCFGDSITEGVGASRENNYPALLGQRVDLEVINSGVAGDTTTDALKRIDEDVLEYDPKLVIVMLGANDFFKKIPKETTRQNLNEIVSVIQRHGAMVLLAGVRIGILRNEYASVYRDVARENKTLLILDIMDGIIDDPKSKFDRIHPNDNGYRIIADRIYQTIAPYLKEH